MPVVVGLDLLGDLAVQVFDLLLDESQELFGLSGGQLGQLVVSAVLLRDAQLHQRTPSRDQIRKDRLVFPLDRVRPGIDPAGETRQYLGVDAVGLLQLAQGPGELPDPLGVDDAGGDAAGQQRGGEASVVSSGGLDDNQANPGGAKSIDQTSNGLLGVVEGEPLMERPVDEDVQRLFRDIDADDGLLRNGWRRRIVLHGGVPALRMRTGPGEGPVQPAVRP